MKESELVSVIIPAYNAGTTIGDALISILGQTHQELEVIVVNDGSTDATSSIVRGFHDPRIHLIEQTNAGVCAARNAGLDRARGTYIGFLDADDAMEPTNLAEKLQALHASGTDWVYSDLMYCDANLAPTGRISVGTDGDVVDTILLGQETAVPTPCSNVIAKRACFDDGIRLDTSLSTSADQDLAIQLARAHSYHHLPKALYRYRDLPASMSKNIALYVKDHTALFAKADRLGWFRNQQFRRTCYANMYYAFAGSWYKLKGDRRNALRYAWKAFRMDPSLALRYFHSIRK